MPIVEEVVDYKFVVNFEKTDGVNTLRDAIVFFGGPIPSESKIEAMKQARFDDWLAIINASPIEEVEE